jgi:hypothetical protein
MAESRVCTGFGVPAAASAQERVLSLISPHWYTDVTSTKLFQAVALIHDRDIDGGRAHALASMGNLPASVHELGVLTAARILNNPASADDRSARQSRS